MILEQAEADRSCDRPLHRHCRATGPSWWATPSGSGRLPGADQCLVVTDGPHAWLTDGDRYQKASVGEEAGASVLAVAADHEGNAYAVSAAAKGAGLVVTRRAAGSNDWRVATRVPLQLPPRTVPRATFAAISPAGALWIGLRASSGGGEDVGYGAVEIDLQTGLAVQHRPRKPGETAPIEALPLPADLNAVLFDGGGIWFASLSGVARFLQGQLSTWGEADGLASELCWSLARGADGAIWAATSEGIARFDGKAGIRPRLRTPASWRCTVWPPTTAAGSGRRPPRGCGSWDARNRTSAPRRW